MRVRLIQGWHTWHKWWSTRLKAAGLVFIVAPETILTVWNSIPHDIKSTLPTEWLTWFGVVLVIASSVAQLVKQHKLDIDD